MADEIVTGQETQPPVAPAAPEAPKHVSAYIWGVGRRKKSVARVRIKAGSGKILVNDRPVEEFFRNIRDLEMARVPLKVANMAAGYDVWVNVNGGGTTGQADAVRMGLARALIKAAPEVGQALRDAGLMTRDARMKERKKYGQKGARKRFQFSKR